MLAQRQAVLEYNLVKNYAYLIFFFKIILCSKRFSVYVKAIGDI